MLGIDIGSYSIKAAVTKKSGKRVTIEQVASEILPPEHRGGSANTSTLQALVTSLIKKVGKGQKTVALSIPTSSAILKTIQVNSSIGDDMLEGEVQLELVNFVPFPLDQVYADFVRLGQSEQNPDQDNIFVAASRKDVVDKVANAVSVKSINQKEIEIEAFAIAQILEQLKGKNYRDAYGIIDIGYQSSTVCVFKSGDMLFSREQQIGGHHLTEAIAESSGIELLEAEQIKHNTLNGVASVVVDNYLDSVSEQIALALEFFNSTNDIDIQAIYVTGGGSLVTGLIDNLSENIPTYQFEHLPIGQEITIGKKKNGLSTETISATAAVATGLAMRK